MADITLTAAPFLDGANIEIHGNRIVERDDLALVSIAIPLNREAELASALNAGWSLSLPQPTQSTTAKDARAIRMTPDQIMLAFPHATPDAERHVQSKLKGAGYTTEQTDAWIVLEVSGPNTMAALERLCPLDLASFDAGTSGRTVMEHMGAMVVKLGDDQFLLMSASSSARSFLHAVETSYAYVT